MSPRPPLSILALALAACALPEPAVTAPAHTPPPGVEPAPPPPSIAPLFAKTQPAPGGALLRVFVDPEQLVGWIAGSASHQGRVARIELGGERREAIVGPDNTFAAPYRVTKATEAIVRVDGMEQRVTLEPPAALEPTVLFVVDRTAYRPGQRLAFAGFLRRMDGGGVFRPIRGGAVEVRLTSETRKTIAARIAATADADGRIAGAYTFSPADPIDDYTLSIPGHRGTARVTLAEFRKSKVKLEVDAAIAGAGATLHFRALDFLDKPIPGGKVQFTAQVVRDDAPPAAAGGLDGDDFAYGAPPRPLAAEDALRYAADPDAAGAGASGMRTVVVERKGEVALGAAGAATHALAIKGEWTRGRHRLLVDATIVDAHGREQRAVRSLPLERRDVRIRLAAPHDLAAAGEPLDVEVGVVDASGRAVAATASVVAQPIPPAVGYGLGYAFGHAYDRSGNVIWNGGNGWNGWNGWNGAPANVHRACRYTALGCRSWQRPRAAGRPAAEAGAIAAVATVERGVARLVLDEPGAYRLHAVARLADGSSVWSELGVAIRERDALPPLVLELDRDEVRQGERLTARLSSRFHGGRALVVARDAGGIKLRRTVALPGGAASVELPIPAELGHGAAIDAYLLGERGEVLAAQRPVRVIPALRTLAIGIDAKPTYGPGETVDLTVDAGRAEAVDLVISVHDQALLGIAPDRGPDPAGFYLADQRLRARGALPLIRARLGDLSVGDVVAAARRITERPEPDGGEPDPDRAAADQVVQAFDRGRLDLRTLVALLRIAGIHAVSHEIGYGGWQEALAPDRRARIRGQRVIDLLETAARPLSFEAVADAVIVRDPAVRAAGPAFVTSRGAARGDSHFSVTGNAVFSAPAPAPIAPTPLAIEGGGGAGGADVVRRDFSDSAYWSGHLRTGADGKARVRFKLPDSLTNWQVVVTAVARDGSVGRRTAKLRTVRDVMIWPMIPRQFTEGDTVSVFGTVHNLTGADRDVVVSIRAANADVLSPAEVTVRVPSGKNVPVTWRVRAREPGLATLLMSAAAPGGGAADASEKRIPVVGSSAEQVVTASGFADRQLVVELPQGVDPRSAQLELTLAPSLAADVVDTLDYLVEYPYGCAEQTMSRFVPAIRVAGVLGNLGISGSGLALRLPGVVAGGFKRLAELQQPDGGWGWQSGGQTHEMMTPYVVWGLLEARRAGHALPDEAMLERGLARVRTFVAQLGAAQLSDRTYLMYVLSQRERLSDAHWRFLVEHRERMSDYALALVLEMAVARGDRAHADRVAGDLRARAQRTGGWTRWRTAGFSRWMEDPFEVTAAVLKALVAYDPDHALVPEVIAYFVANKRGDRWNSTKDTAMVLYAITELLAKQAGRWGRGDSAIEYTVNGGAPARAAFTDGLVREVRIPGDRLRARNVIAFPSASPGVMARAVLRYRRTGRDLAPAASGLEVTRALHLLDGSGKVVRRLGAGDRVPRGSYVESVVTVTHAGGQAMRYLLVEDPKPAGAETLPEDDPRFPRVNRTWSLREDREQKLAYHHEATGPTTIVRSIMLLEMAGEVALPPAHAELMYQTQTRGHSGTIVLRVD